MSSPFEIKDENAECARLAEKAALFNRLYEEKEGRQSEWGRLMQKVIRQQIEGGDDEEAGCI